MLPVLRELMILQNKITQEKEIKLVMNGMIIATNNLTPVQENF